MLWVKAFHILFVIAWLAGLFYLPRIFVHYREGQTLGEDVRRLVVMAQKLFRFTTVMSIPALASGLWLWLGYGISGDWLIAKLALIILLIAYHGVCYVYLTKMKEGRLWISSLFFRFFNEGALFIVIPILILVVVKPNF